jgi:hypothetical protein
MFQRIILLLITGVLLVSCDFFQKKNIDDSQIVDTIIDFKSVDMFPLYPSCERFISQEKQQICSQSKISKQLYESLNASQIITLRKINDTLFLKLGVDAKGKVALLNIKSTDLLKQQIPKLDSLIKNGVSNLPELKPAIKRGIPVAMEFGLSIVVVN